MSGRAGTVGPLAGALGSLAAAALLVGCAATGPAPPPPEPHPGRYAASSHQLAAADWVGEYVGTGEALVAGDETWTPVAPVGLQVRQIGPDRVAAVGAVAGLVRWDLAIAVKATTPGVLSGRYQAAADQPWFTYSLALRGPRVTGVVRRYAAGALPPEAAVEDPGAPQEEWMIDVLRQARED